MSCETFEEHVKDECSIPVDQPVVCLLNNQKKYGILRFCGETEFSSGMWYGIELNEPCGKNDGTVANVRYFKCEEKYGIFVNSKHVFPTTEPVSTSKQIKRRVLPNVVQDARFHDIELERRDVFTNGENILEGRPRSQSDNGLTNERTTRVHLFSDSPFRCDFGGKSLSFPKLNNDTYIRSSPLNEGDGLVHPRHSSPLAQESLNEVKLTTSQEVCPVSQSNDETFKSPEPLHHHVQLSPHLEVKQSIKLGSISKLSAPLSSVKRSESGLNKTYLVRKQMPRLPKKIEEKKTSSTKESGGNCKKNDDKQEIVSKQSSVNENLNQSTFVSVDESCSEGRSRSVSSVESISSVGSSNTERSRLKSTSVLNESSKKAPRTTDSSKSRLLKISAESKIKSKIILSKEAPKTIRKSSIPNPGMKAAVTDSGLKSKSRTKSTTSISGGFKSVFDTPLNKKTATTKSKSVSSEGAIAKSSTSRLSTPFGSNISGNIAPRSRLSSASRVTPMSERKPKVSSMDSFSSKKTGVQSTINRGVLQDSNKTEIITLSKQVKVAKSDKRQVKQEENKTSITRSRIMSTPVFSNVKSSGIKSSSLKPPISRTTRSTINGLREPRKVAELSVEQSALKKKISSSQELVKNEKTITSYSALTPDILKQIPEIKRHSVGVQVDNDDFEISDKVQSLTSMLNQRNREFEATLVALQLYSQKVDVESNKVQRLRNCVVFTKDKVLNAKRIIEKEANQRVRLEDEMLSIKSDSVVELALLGAEYERKQELIEMKIIDDRKKSLEKARKRNFKALEDVRRSCDLKLERVEETYVQDIGRMNEKHKDIMTELESQHSKVVEELIEERNAEIETIKEDYEEQMEQLQERLSESNVESNKLSEKLKMEEQQSTRDIETRIQDAIAKYKTLPAELESMTFVLEMKTDEIKKLRKSIGIYQNQIDDLQQAKNRATLLEREKESLHFVVENKAQFGRKLSIERDKLRLSLDREVAASKRLSLENEELSWRLNTFQNSPTSPSFEKINWRMQSGFSSPDSAFFSQRIEESDLESQMDDTKETCH